MLKGPVVAYPEKLPMELVRLQCAKTPKATAVLLPGGKTLRYSDLDTASLEALVRGIDPVLAKKHQFLDGKGLDDPACIIKTSGTTGPVKRVVKTNRNIVQRIAWDSPAPGDLQLLYPHGLPRLIIGLATGHPVAVMSDHPAGSTATLRQIAESGATHITLFPVSLHRFMVLGIPLPTIKEIVSIGDKLPEELAAIFAQQYPHIKVVNSYGSAEAGYCMRDWQPVANTSVFVEAPEGETGRLSVQGPTVGYGYAFGPVFKHGIFHSEDLAREVDGRIELAGRVRS